MRPCLLHRQQNLASCRMTSKSMPLMNTHAAQMMHEGFKIEPPKTRASPQLVHDSTHASAPMLDRLTAMHQANRRRRDDAPVGSARLIGSSLAYVYRLACVT